MLGALKWLHLLALGTWVGTIVFFSFVGAPGIFGAFPPEQRAEAGRIVSGIFTGYYRLGYACGAVLLATALFFWSRGSGGLAPWGYGSGVAAVMLGATLYAGLVIQPRAHELRPLIHQSGGDADAKAEFDRLHRRAVQLNVVVLLGGLIATGFAASSLRP